MKINYLAVLAAVVASFVLGFIWYGPLFGEPWMGMVGLTQAEVEANPPGASTWIANIVAAIIPAVVMAWLFGKMGVDSVLQGAGIGLLIAFAFIFLSRMTSGLFAQDPYGLAWINGGYDMVKFAIFGAIIGGWRKS